MAFNQKNIVIRTSKTDNVGIVVNSVGLEKGTVLSNGIKLTQKIPMGHKVALERIEEGEKIIRYGQAIGKTKVKPKYAPMAKHRVLASTNGIT